MDKPCENHAHRAGALTVDLPSIGVQRYMCEECRAAHIAALGRTPYKGKREAWDHGSDYTFAAGDLYCDTTRGTVLIHSFEHGETIR